MSAAMPVVVSVGRYVLALRTCYRDTASGLAAGVRHVADVVGDRLDRYGHHPGAEVCKRLHECCTGLFEAYRDVADGFSAGVLSATADLWVALDTYPDPDAWGDVLNVPPSAGTACGGYLPDLWAVTR